MLLLVFVFFVPFLPDVFQFEGLLKKFEHFWIQRYFFGEFLKQLIRFTAVDPKNWTVC